jgi:predicted ArsR family transcriptional regulator
MAQHDPDTFVTKRELILHHLLRNCSSPKEFCTIKSIASAVSLSPTGTRHYLTILENEGLVTHSEKQRKSGRPARIFSLTTRGFNAFPKAYTEFSFDLLDEVKTQFGESAAINLLEQIGRKKAIKISSKLKERGIAIESSGSLKKMLMELVDVFEEEGTFPELIEDNKSFILKNYNCLFYDIAMKEPLVCKLTETLMAQLTNNVAVKEKCLKDGDDCCLFRIKKNNEM